MRNTLRNGPIKFFYILIFPVLAMFSEAGAHAATFLPVVTNYQARDYNGKLQNWDASQLDNGLMCFANNAGLLTFDGYTWNLLKVPGEYICRSVMADGDRIYIGSFEEFGYYFKGSSGVYEYESLSDKAEGDLYRNSEFWNIVKKDGTIYFQSFDNVIAYTPANGKITALPRVTGNPYPGKDFKPLNLFSHKGMLLSQGIGGDLCKAGDSGWECVIPRDKLKSNVIGIAGDIFITSTHGLYKISDNFTPTPFITEADNDLQRYTINRACRTSKGDILIGTIGGGVYLISHSGKLLWHISREEGGICNNSVLGFYPDRGGNLWAMLDDGISLIHTAAPYTMLRPDASQDDIGMVYSIGRDAAGRLIAAGNQGAYSFDSDDRNRASFHLIPGTKGQNWCVRSFDSQLFIGGNDQAIICTGANSYTMEPGSATDLKRGTINGQDIIIQSSYYNLSVYKKKDGGDRWIKDYKLANFGAPVFQLEIASDGTIWASHLTRGVFHLELNSDLTAVERSTYFPSLRPDSVPSICFVMKIRGNIVFTDDETFYTYNEHTGKFDRFDALARQLPWIRQARSATHIDDNTFWISCADAYYLIKFDNGQYHSLLTIPLDNFPRATNGINSSVFADNTGRSYFNLNGGVGRVDIADAAKLSNFKPGLEIAYAGFMSGSGEQIALPGSTDSIAAPEVRQGNFRIVLQYPEFDHRPLRYRFTLDDGGRKIQKTLPVPEILYPTLSPGNYIVLCEVLDENGAVLGSIRYKFMVPRPWPLRWWAIIIYLILICVSGYSLARYYARRRLRQERAKQSMEREARNKEIHRQQLIIAEQEKKLLEKELTAKGKELASMALDAYSRQQVIEQLRQSLHDGTGAKGSGALIKSLSSRLQSLSSSDSNGGEFWSVFERNFDLIHEHFFRNMRQRYPQLTASDLRMCALMRLNLATKDIARFQNMTVRGVETARYRLRKKLAVPAGTNLTEFMIDFSGESEEETPASRHQPSESEVEGHPQT